MNTRGSGFKLTVKNATKDSKAYQKGKQLSIDKYIEKKHKLKDK